MNENLRAFHCITEAMDRIGVQILGGPDLGYMRATMVGAHGVHEISLSVAENSPFVMVWSNFPLRIPEERRPTVAELITRVNGCMIYGAYKLDMDDGVLRFVVTIPMSDETVLTDQIADAIMGTLATVDDANRPFYRLLFDKDLSPAEAAGELVLSRMAPES